MILRTIALAFAAISPSGPAKMEGQASWYGRELRGKTMANGRPFDERKMTCASWFYPIGTQLWVTCTTTGKSVRVCVTDRGPAWRLVLRKNRIIDLSHRAFSCICPTHIGVTKVAVRKWDEKLDGPGELDPI